MEETIDLEAAEPALQEVVNVSKDGSQDEGECGQDDEGQSFGATVHESLLLT